MSSQMADGWMFIIKRLDIQYKGKDRGKEQFPVDITKKNTNRKAVTLIAIRLLIAGHISEENSEIYQVTQ